MDASKVCTAAILRTAERGHERGACTSGFVSTWLAGAKPLGLPGSDAAARCSRPECQKALYRLSGHARIPLAAFPSPERAFIKSNLVGGRPKRKSKPSPLCGYAFRECLGGWEWIVAKELQDRRVVADSWSLSHSRYVDVFAPNRSATWSWVSPTKDRRFRRCPPSVPGVSG